MRKKERIRKNAKPKAEPEGQLFEIHGCEFELNPVGYWFKPAEIGITHAVLFLSVCEDPFNGLTSHFVGCLAQIAVPNVFGLLYVILPEMNGNRFYMVGRSGTALQIWAVSANIRFTLFNPFTFSEKLWCGLLDYATAYADGRLTFTFKNSSTFEG